MSKFAIFCCLRHNAVRRQCAMNMNVSLTDELADFVKSKVVSGRYASSSEVVREALRLMEQQDAEKLAWLRQAYKDGMDSGDAGEIDFAALKKEGRRRLAAKKA
jgi:antitoxin ParD1/3/4